MIDDEIGVDNITIDDLAVAVRRKFHGGTEKLRIQPLINEFASENAWHWRHRRAGSRLVRDIPQNRRAEFLRQLNGL